MTHPSYVRYPDTMRVLDLRRRVRDAMDVAPVAGGCPERIPDGQMSEPLIVRKARAVSLKLAAMPPDLWTGQLLAGSHSFESPRWHFEPRKPGGAGFPDYTTDGEREAAAARGLSITSVFGHIVPNYPRLLSKGLSGIMADAEAQRPLAQTADENAFLDAVQVVCQGVLDYAHRLSVQCEHDAILCTSPVRAAELYAMRDNLRQVPAGPAQTFWQALQSVWLLHMIFHATLDANAIGRLDQYAWPYLEADLAAGRLTIERAAELCTCFCLKFNERAKTTEEQSPDARPEEAADFTRRTRHYTSSQLGTQRDSLDATNHWLQNIVVGGLTPQGVDGTNPLTYLLLEAYRRNQMTNPLLTVRLHRDSPDDLVAYTCAVLKDGGGMPALFNDEQLTPALERFGIPTPDARDYTNDGCWEVIIPGRTDFRFQRLSMALCLEWALNRGVSRADGSQGGVDTGDPRAWTTWDAVWRAFLAQLDAMIGRTVQNVVDNVNDRYTIAPTPLLSALIDGAIEQRRDMTAGGARFRTYGMLAESAAHTIDSLAAIKHVIFDERQGTMADLCAALDADFEGFGPLRARLLAAPKYGNDDPYADAMGQALIDAFTEAVNRHASAHMQTILFPTGVATFSWYIGIGEGLGASADGRRAGEPVSSNFSPALGRDKNGLPCAILSYASMHKSNLPAGGPLDLRLNRHLVQGDEGTQRMVGLVRSFVETGGNMMTLTVVDTEELRSAQVDPDRYRSLRVRMGGWCAYFTMLSHEQQEHHIKRQEGRS
jgi:formate C-acetyltransferase